MTGFDPNQWLTTSEAAELTGYTRAHIRRMLIAKQIEGIKRGRDWLINRESILDHKRRMDALGPKKHSPIGHEDDSKAGD